MPSTEQKWTVFTV